VINLSKYSRPENLALHCLLSSQMKACRSWPKFDEIAASYGAESTIPDGLDPSIRLISPEVLRDQAQDPGCIGEGVGFTFSRPGAIVSGRGIWCGARIIDNDLGDADQGTSLDSAFCAVSKMGLPPYHADEHDPTSENHVIDTHNLPLADQLIAFDARTRFEVYRIDNSDASDTFEQIWSALAMPESRIVITSGLKPSFFNLANGGIATGLQMGGNDDRHCQVICGADYQTREVFYCNSWGKWAGLWIPVKRAPRPPMWQCEISQVNVASGLFWTLPGAYRGDLSTLQALSEIRVVRRLAA